MTRSWQATSKCGGRFNVRRDPRVVLSMETGGPAPYGLAEYLVVHGRARVTEGGAPELLQHLAHVYLGPDLRCSAHRQPTARLHNQDHPERIGGVDPGGRDPLLVTSCAPAAPRGGRTPGEQGPLLRGCDPQPGSLRHGARGHWWTSTLRVGSRTRLDDTRQVDLCWYSDGPLKDGQIESHDGPPDEPPTHVPERIAPAGGSAPFVGPMPRRGRAI